MIVPALDGLRVAVFVSTASSHATTRALAARGAVVDRVPSGTGAIDALLSGRDHILVSDRLVAGVMVVMHPRHLVTAPFGQSFGDQFVEFMLAPPEPRTLAAAVARAARRLGLSARLRRPSEGGIEAA